MRLVMSIYFLRNSINRNLKEYKKNQIEFSYLVVMIVEVFY